MALPYSALLCMCVLAFNSLKITNDNVERATCDQAYSKVWFPYRAERVTASRFTAVACTDWSQPSQ